MSLSTGQRLILLAFCVSLAAVVPFLTLVVLATQEPTVLARELLSDADCTRCLDVRRRADFLISELPVLSAISEVVTAQGTSVAMLSLDCAAKGGSSRLRISATIPVTSVQGSWPEGLGRVAATPFNASGNGPRSARCL